jgi:AraC-like DNA-binding protein
MISKKDIHIFGERHRILLQANEFICILPHHNLREYISNYNITFPTKDIMPDRFTAMPCGCSTLSIENDSKNLFVDLHGPTAKPYIVGSQANQLKMMVTIEFKPAGLYALTGISQNELTDETISLRAVNPKLSQLISEAVEKAGSVYELVTSLDMLLLENMYAAYHPQLKLMFQNILDCAGNITVKRLSDDIHYSERQLNRIFKQYVGVSVKSFSRLIRINNSFRLLKKPNNSLTLVSDVMGFHDLPHFIHDFKSVCGITPQEYRNNMSDFYINTKKL